MFRHPTRGSTEVIKMSKQNVTVQKERFTKYTYDGKAVQVENRRVVKETSDGKQTVDIYHVEKQE